MAVSGFAASNFDRELSVLHRDEGREVSLKHSPMIGRTGRAAMAAAVLLFVSATQVVSATQAAAQAPTPAPVPPVRPSLDCQSDSSSRADFNGDGVQDVAIGAPLDDLFSNRDVGSLNVVYGASGDSGGLNSTGDDLLSPATGGMPAFKWVFGPGRFFAKSMAAGDFNNDTFTDLAVGAPGSPVDDIAGTGAVFVLYGSADGMSTRFSQALHQDRLGVPEHNDTGDAFGWSLGAGDFNGDGADDLAISAPGEDFGRLKDGGTVTVIYGKTGARPAGGGLSTAAPVVTPQLLVQGARGLLETFDPGDMFGLALAAGNFNGDAVGSRPIDDLAIGVPQEDIGIRADTGGVQVVYGSSAGLTGDDQFWHQASPQIEGANETGDLYGCALAAGNFEGLRFGEAPNLIDADALAIGVPGEDLLHRDQGGVAVIYPAPTGIGLSESAGPAGPGDDDIGDQFFIEQPSLGNLRQPAQQNARFGQTLNAQNIDRVRSAGPPQVIDHAWELVIGVPGANNSAGEVYVIGGVTGDGLRAAATNTYLLTQDTQGTHRAAETGDEFGRSIGFGDYDGDTDMDIVLGAPGDSTCSELNEIGEFLSIGPGVPIGAGPVARAGAALTLYSDGTQIGAGNGPFIHLTPPGLGNYSLTRCDLITDATDIYGLSGDPQENAEFSQTIAGL